MPAWDDYQEEIATFFREIGFSAETNVALEGVRTSHDVDVVVRGNHLGFDLLWLIECKDWQRPVNKLHVLALRQIVTDVGGDKGFLVTEAGYQRGASEAAGLTNIQLTSLAELKTSSADAIGTAQLRSLEDRVDQCKKRYWGLDKQIRIKHHLRSEYGEHNYSGTRVLAAVEAALSAAFRRSFPVAYSEMGAMVASFTLPNEPGEWDRWGGAVIAHSPTELYDTLERTLLELERRLKLAEDDKET
jgi:restriction system protein